MAFPLLALVPLLASAAPEIIRWIAGDRAGQVAQQVTSVVEAVTGSTDAADLQAALADPAKAGELRLRLAEIAAQQEDAARQAELEQLRATLADTASARLQTVELAKAGSPLQWGAAIVSTIVLVGFAVVAWLVLTRTLPEGSREVALYTVGALQTMAGAVVAYWVGSSSGSARKDALLQGAAAGPFVRGARS